MSRLREVTWNDDAFRVLVLGGKQKTLIHGLVRQHASQLGSGFDDIIKGKGRGLIGLLAGTPGCGKTLTAEAVAEVTRRPLYAVSAGELGTTPKEVEGRLLNVLELAQMWDAVLLLDEAEVFLQQRNTTDVNRNALVSIFLRQLEYYQGILILTTNMAEQCDRAFESEFKVSSLVHDIADTECLLSKAESISLYSILSSMPLRGERYGLHFSRMRLSKSLRWSLTTLPNTSSTEDKCVSPSVPALSVTNILLDQECI